MIKVIKKVSPKEMPKPKQIFDVTGLRQSWLNDVKETKERQRRNDIKAFGAIYRDRDLTQ